MEKNHRMAALLFGAALLSGPTRSAFATPTGNPLPGPTGLGVTPTTGTVAPGSIELYGQYEHYNYADVDGDADVLPLASATYGFKNGEFGGVFVREKTTNSGFTSKENYFALHGKYRVFDNEKGGQVAVGAHYYDFGSSSGFDLGNVATVYLSGSYDLGRKGKGPAKVRLHGGVMYQRIDTGADKDNVVRPYAGLEYFVTPEVTLAADYLDKKDVAARAYTVAARYQPIGHKWGAQVGIGKQNNDTKIFAGIGYSFGTK